MLKCSWVSPAFISAVPYPGICVPLEELSVDFFDSSSPVFQSADIFPTTPFESACSSLWFIDLIMKNADTPKASMITTEIMAIITVFFLVFFKFFPP